jgi:hypothetical protein
VAVLSSLRSLRDRVSYRADGSALPPRIVVTGMPRAGSTRLYNIIREALLARYPEARHAHFGDWETFEAALADPSPGVFKEHTFGEEVEERVRHCDVQAVAAIREPLPAMISVCATFGRSAEEAASWVDESLMLIERLTPSVRIYGYRTATSANPAKVRMLVRDIGLAVGWYEAARLSYRWSRRRVQKLSDRLSGDPMSSDALTLLHPGQVGAVRAVALARLAS